MLVFKELKDYIINTNNMSYLTHLKRNKHSRDSRWIVKLDQNNLIKEVKLIFNPEEYRTRKNAKPLHTQKGLIKILEKEKQKRVSG
tara:strand:+ start:4957 stop:5214 length:258 start_codon:yes stop_codon:yes gene_type:complete